MKNLSGMSYPELQKEAKLLNIKSIGVKKDDLISLITTARSKEAKKTSTEAHEKTKKETKKPAAKATTEKAAALKKEKAVKEPVAKAEKVKLDEVHVNVERSTRVGEDGKTIKEYTVKENGKVLKGIDFKDPETKQQIVIDGSPFTNLENAIEFHAKVYVKHMNQQERANGKENATKLYRYIKYENPDRVPATKKEASKKMLKSKKTAKSKSKRK